MKQRLYFVIARSPLHIGSGEGAGMIDLPFIREASTGLPLIPGSSMKGVLRDAFTQEADGNEALKKEVDDLFGLDYLDHPEPSKVRSGLLVIDDAFLLCLPVRSMSGTFAWITCPFALRRLKRSLGQAEVALPEQNIHPKDFAIPQWTFSEEKIISQPGSLDAGDRRVLLEELLLYSVAEDEAGEAQARQARDQWAAWLTKNAVADPDWQEELKERFAIVSDEVFAFLAETATDIRARIRLGEDGTTAHQALWYEELLPSDSLFWGHWTVLPVRAAGLEPDEAEGKITARALILGGKQTVGRGLVDFRPIPVVAGQQT
ncbi:MAG: type III-B CRISPR module RAMP protein Cmr4 [Methylococcaceae bacterium]|nr:type III-B CRISPR module RAMP protein Cmr4 [Methylococcaceae bacterium]